MLESGEYASSAELAKVEKVNDSYVSRILLLTLTTPSVTEAGRQPSTLRLRSEKYRFAIFDCTMASFVIFSTAGDSWLRSAVTKSTADNERT